MTKILIFYYAIISSFALLLSGCSALHTETLLFSEPEKNESKTKQFYSVKSVLPTLPSILTIPQQSNQTNHLDDVNQITPYTYQNWNSAIQLMINKMLQIQEINPGSILLIENINNDTNFSLNFREINRILCKLFNDNKKFTLVSEEKLSLAKQKLGLLPQDSLGIRSKEIGIARSIGVKYILYYKIIKNINNTLELKMQLILTQSGEILWSERTVVQ